MAIIDSRPHPRVLFVGYSEDDAGFLEMTDLVPTWARWDGHGSAIRWADWDAIVACREFEYEAVAHRVQVLAFSGASLPMVHRNTQGLGGVEPDQFVQPSPEMETNDALPRALSRLVRDELIPWLRSLEKRPLLAFYGHGLQPFPTQVSNAYYDPTIAPLWFVRDADGTMIAGAYETGHSNTAWWIPFTPPHPARWLSAALEVWAGDRPDQFPIRDPWRTRFRWMSRDESTAATQIEEREAELLKLQEEQKKALEQLRDVLRSAQGAAEAGIRRLLTAQGDDLVDAVAEALEALGFEVVRVDDTLAPGQAKKEDLRVTLPGGGTAIAEVKGYTAGAKQGDLLKITRYAAGFERETGTPPARQWYVCNQFLDTDPDTRPEILAGADESLAVFAGDGGAVIDTRELFRLVRAVEDGHLLAEGARTALWASAMRFAAPDLNPAVE